ncbi:hypothetical protein VKT23_010369 [Stygiomarasmius scandens]|uniref:F-box domain-containing protein n=1 Tax=Marasmiellus scandens TaxID=2682957 RepID=A0ABR1JBH1_9AGAR
MVNHNLEFPPEIADKIILFLWNSILSSSDRILFTTTCPLLNKMWKAQFKRIASRDIYIPSLSYLLYLASIAWRGKSFIYSQRRLRECAEAMTCFLDLRSSGSGHCSEFWDKKTEEVYWLLSDLGRYSRDGRGLKRCFPSLKHLTLEVAIHTPTHLWTSEMPQVAYTQIVLGLDPETGIDVDIDIDVGKQRVKLPLRLNITIHDSDAYLGVTDALWKYRVSPISAYLGQLVNVVMGGLMGGVRLPRSYDGQMLGDTGRILRLSKLLHKSRRLEGSMHLFSTTVAYLEPPIVQGLRSLDPRFCPKWIFEDFMEEKGLLASHSVCTPLCQLRMWLESSGLIKLMENGGWGLIIPYSALDEEDRCVREIVERRKLEGVQINSDDPTTEDYAIMKRPRVLRWYDFSPFPALKRVGPSPFSAVEDLRQLVESGLGYDS